jgi:hypothetical protein
MPEARPYELKKFISALLVIDYQNKTVAIIFVMIVK